MLGTSKALPSQLEEEQDRLLICRGPLSLATDPLEFWFRDRPVPLSPSEGALLALLMRRGRASWQAIDDQLYGGKESTATREVMVYRIRRKFKAVGADNPIETVRGWGLKLQIGGQHGHPSGLLIGARKPAFATY
jgi:DNA-binding response OmpR family regulator